MPKKRHSPEQIVTKLRQIDVLVAQGRTIGQACKECEITDQSYYRWRNEYGGLEIEQRCGDHEELRGLVERPGVPRIADVLEEVVGDLVQRQGGDIEPVLRDEREKHIEWPGELLELDDEALFGRGGGRDRHRLGTAPLASSRSTSSHARLR